MFHLDLPRRLDTLRESVAGIISRVGTLAFLGQADVTEPLPPAAAVVSD